MSTRRHHTTAQNVASGPITREGGRDRKGRDDGKKKRSAPAGSKNSKASKELRGEGGRLVRMSRGFSHALEAASGVLSRFGSFPCPNSTSHNPPASLHNPSPKCANPKHLFSRLLQGSKRGHNTGISAAVRGSASSSRSHDSDPNSVLDSHDSARGQFMQVSM